MGIRLFNCRACGHKMSFDTEVCGMCYCSKWVYQRRRFYVATTAVMALSTVAIVNG